MTRKRQLFLINDMALPRHRWSHDNISYCRSCRKIFRCVPGMMLGCVTPDPFISTSCCYLERFDLILESLVFRLLVLHAMLGLTQLGFQLGLQLPAALLKLQQLLLSLLEAVGTPKINQIRRVETE